MLRVLIDDLDSADYTDARLEQLLAVSGKYVNEDIGTSYVINIVTPDISPDPVDVNDNVFVNLNVLKAACLVDQGNMRSKAALSGLEARCGPAVLKTGGVLEGIKLVLSNGPCASYKELVLNYVVGNGLIGHGVLSPFISNTFDPSILR